jgi:hypothetical protein
MLAYYSLTLFFKSIFEPGIAVCRPLYNNIYLINLMSVDKGTLRRCTLCDDGVSIKKKLWTIHWQRKHANIPNSKLQYIVINEENKETGDNVK